MKYYAVKYQNNNIIIYKAEGMNWENKALVGLSKTINALKGSTEVWSKPIRFAIVGEKSIDQITKTEYEEFDYLAGVIRIGVDSAYHLFKKVNKNK